MARKREKKNSGDTEIFCQIYRFMQKEGLYELDWEQNGVKARIKRYRTSKTDSVSSNNPHPNPKHTKKDFSEKAKEEDVPNSYYIKSPIVGVFYRTPSPDSLPFAEEGDIVEKEQTVCIIEAMKLMNEIRTEKRCKIIRTLVDHGEHVNVGQELFLTSYL